MAERDLEELVEAVTSAHRPLTPRGELRFHPAWHDLPPAERRLAAEHALVQRRLEAILAPDGLSSTVQAVLARITRRAE